MWPPDLFRRCFGYKFPRLGAAANNWFFKLSPRFADVQLFPGIALGLDFRDLTQRTTYWQGSRFEYPTAHILAEWGKRGATTFFDIGANYGFFSYWMLSNFPRLDIYSFEPTPAVYQIIEKAKERNNLANLRPQALGLSDKAETLSLHLGVTDSGHSTFGDHPELGNAASVQVPVLPFDEWRETQGIPLPSAPQWIAKIDVEGFELRVLNGMAGSLKARAFIGLAVEMNEFTMEFSGTEAGQILGLMEAHGYRLRHPLGAYKTNANAFFIPS
jgi:FkbM family methyltransferase